MKTFNLVMTVVRMMAVAIMVFCIYAFAFKKEKELLEPVVSYFIIFVVLYFFGSLVQLLIRLKSQGRYPARSQMPEGGSETETNNK